MHTREALIRGSQAPELWNKTLGTLVDEQAACLGNHDAVVVPWQNVRLSYRQLAEQSKVVARALVNVGFGHGDVVGIMAGNRHEYISVLLGAARLGCPVVVLNNNYTPEELIKAVQLSCKWLDPRYQSQCAYSSLLAACKAVFIAATISSRSLHRHIQILRGTNPAQDMPPDLQYIVSFGQGQSDSTGAKIHLYEDFISQVKEFSFAARELRRAESKVHPRDVLNLQFTSGKCCPS